MVRRSLICLFFFMAAVSSAGAAQNHPKSEIVLIYTGDTLGYVQPCG